MSYYRYITGLYKSDLRALNRTLRSSSVPRHVPDLETARLSRASSVPPVLQSSSFLSHSATPFSDRARSVPREVSYSSTSTSRGYTATDLDSKAEDYMNRLDMQHTVRSSVNQARNYSSTAKQYSSDSFSSRYNYYDGNKHERDYMYPVASDVMGSWKHYNLSSDTINTRNTRARSPLQSRELDRYYETKKYSNYMGDVSSGGAVDFRHYNYRQVPYFGGSDNYQYMKARPGRRL